MLTPSQQQANYNNLRIIDSPWRALFCIDHDHIIWHAKVILLHYQAYFGNFFTFLVHKTNRLHFAVVCSLIDTH